MSLIERGESFYQDLMKSIVEFLNEKRFLEEDEGRKVMFAKGIQVSFLHLKMLQNLFGGNLEFPVGKTT